MPTNTKAIKVDLNGDPIPQHFNPAADDYEGRNGRNGAAFTELVDRNGIPFNTSSGALPVEVTGSTVDLRGLAANRPAAGSVAVGTTYWSVDTGAVEVSIGVAWVVI